MYFRQGNNWSLGVSSNPQLLMALYLRELGGINPLDTGPNSALAQRSKPRARQTSNCPGQIRQEWCSWWDSLMKDSRALNEQRAPDLLGELAAQGYPELRKLAHAHYGQATLFAQNHVQDFTQRSKQFIPARLDEVEKLMTRRGIDHLPGAPAIHVQLVDLPLHEPRAWLSGTTVLASSRLLHDAQAFAGYMEPIISAIFQTDPQ
ncbi:hypothetical protein [Glutamicibacter uratoxydans]|uniref:hypothetical protein n=1 Tax=Glutamicibacter uratoxydans TaxID=43667 RepID=UPI003D6FBC37